MIKLALYTVVLPWIVLGGLFLAYPTVQRLKGHRSELGWIMVIPIYALLFVGVLADFVFNATWGTWIFRELPKWNDRELLFTSRLKRHWYGTNEKQRRRAFPWVNRANLIAPGHI